MDSLKANNPRVEPVSLYAGGDGIEMTLARLSESEFFDFIDGTVNPDTYLDTVEKLPQSYSNSNPIFEDCTLEMHDSTENYTKLAIERADKRASVERITITEPGSFYILASCDAREAIWHQINSVFNFDETSAKIRLAEVRLSNTDDHNWLFVEGISHKGIESESQDASTLENYSYDLIDDRGHVYSLDCYFEGSTLLPAIEALTALIRGRESLDTVAIQALMRRGDIYARLGRREEAIADLEKASAPSELSAETCYKLASSFCSLGNHARGFELLSWAIEHSGINACSSFLTGNIYRLRAEAAKEGKKPAVAIKDYRHAIDCFSKTGKDNLIISDCMINLGALIEEYTNGNATDLFCDAITLSPLNIKRLDKDAIKRVLLAGNLSASALTEITSSLLIGETLEIADTRIQQEAAHNPSEISLSRLIQSFESKYEITNIDEKSSSFYLGSKFLVRALLLQEDIFLMLSTVFTNKRNRSREELLALVNTINNEFALVRASLVDDGHILLDYYICLEGGHSLDGLTEIVDIFLDAVELIYDDFF